MRGRDMSKEIIKPLEKARAVARVTEPNKAGYKCIEQHIDQALNFVKQQPSQQECDAAMVEGFEHTISKEDEEWMNAPMGTPKQQPPAEAFTKNIRDVLKVMDKDGKFHRKIMEEACNIIDSAESINADLLAASERGLSYINAIVCKVPRPITELKEDKEFVEDAVSKAKKEGDR